MKRDKNKIYIIAEIGGNFVSFEEARLLIDAAADCGVDAVKLQTYRAETLSSQKAMFHMENTGDVSQYDLFEKYSISGELHKKVFDYARDKGLDIFSSPSHKTDVELLESLNVDAYKTGSDDAVNLPLLKYIAALNKPVFYATGMCTLEEVKESVDTMLSTGNDDIIIMHAITAYPTHPEDVNLRAIGTLKNTFPNLSVGYSDHTLGINACLFAAAMGAEVLEKHFTYDKNAPGPDHMHSADPAQMAEIVKGVREFEVMRGSGIKMPAKSEQDTRINNRKSLVLLKDIPKGQPIDLSSIDIKRPGYGIAPKYIHQVTGRIAGRNLQKEDVLRWEDLS